MSPGIFQRNDTAKIIRNGYGLKGTVIATNVKHDDWCKWLKGQSECDCDPDIEVFAVGEDGQLSLIEELQ